MRSTLLAIAALAVASAPAFGAEDFTVSETRLRDEKAVFATVEAVREVPARVRTGGTVVRLSVREGDRVERGQVVAVVADEKIGLRIAALDAEIAGLKAQLAQAQTDLSRAEPLLAGGYVAKSRIDELRTGVSVATQSLKARTAERAVLDRQTAEGEVAAPAAGRVLTVPVATGSVVMAGETVATIAGEGLMVRLSVPERHARFLAAGDAIRLDGEDLTGGGTGAGVVTLVYPHIVDGRVTADARVEGLSDRFVGQRVRVWVPGGARSALVVPEHLLTVRFGLDYARLRAADGATVEAPVQRGRPAPSADLPDGLEILSGLRPGDVLVRP